MNSYPECETALQNNHNNINNYALITLCMIFKKYIFNMANSWSSNLSSKKRFNEVTKCLVSSEFTKIRNDRIQVNIKQKINMLYSSMCCICFNRNQLSKNRGHIKIYLGGTNIKLSHPSYYAIQHKQLIEKFQKEKFDSEKNKKDTNIILRFIETSAIEFILNNQKSSIDMYNNSPFYGSSCNNGEIIANEIKKKKKDKCPQKYYLIYKDKEIAKITAENIDKFKLYQKKKFFANKVMMQK